MGINVDIFNVVWGICPGHIKMSWYGHIIRNTMKSLNVLISRALEINEISVKYMKNIHLHI